MDDVDMLGGELRARVVKNSHQQPKTLGDLLKARLDANDRQEGGQHYKQMGVQPWAVVDTWPLEQQIGYYRGGALKYIMRLGTKDQALQEAKKAGHYIEKLVGVLSQHEHAK